jgi:prepilin-type N-terminal cleavage/methylation domain-containing protein
MKYTINDKPQTKNQNGFTFVELIIVMGILGILGLLLATTMSQGLRGQNKANLINQLKQNGQYALDYLEKEIREADKVFCGDPMTKNTLILQKSGRFIRYRFVSGQAGQINGKIVYDTPNTQPNGTNPLECSEGLPAVGISELTNTDPDKGVDIREGQFTRNPGSSSYKDIVTVSFSVHPTVNAAKLVESQIGPTGIAFSTTVELR